MITDNQAPADAPEQPPTPADVAAAKIRDGQVKPPKSVAPRPSPPAGNVTELAAGLRRAATANLDLLAADGGDPAHLVIVEGVEDVLEVIGEEDPAYSPPRVDVDVRHLPHDKQRHVLKQLLGWDGGHVEIHASIVLFRTPEHPRLRVSFAPQAVCQATMRPTTQQWWSLDAELRP